MRCEFGSAPIIGSRYSVRYGCVKLAKNMGFVVIHPVIYYYKGELLAWMKFVAFPEITNIRYLILSC